MAKCPICGAKLVRSVMKRGRKKQVYKNYKCTKCGKV